MGILKGPVIPKKLKFCLLKTSRKFKASLQGLIVFCVWASRERHFETLVKEYLVVDQIIRITANKQKSVSKGP